MGGYFVVVEMNDGRVWYTAKRYRTDTRAQSMARDITKRQNVKAVHVCYSQSEEIDIKKYI